MRYVLKTDWRKKISQIRKPKWTHTVNKKLHTPPKNNPPHPKLWTCKQHVDLLKNQEVTQFSTHYKIWL